MMKCVLQDDLITPTLRQIIFITIYNISLVLPPSLKIQEFSCSKYRYRYRFASCHSAPLPFTFIDNRYTNTGRVILYYYLVDGSLTFIFKLLC